MSNQKKQLALPQNEAHEPSRLGVVANVGNYVRKGDFIYRILQVLDYNTVIGVEVESGRSFPLSVAELLPIEEDASISQQDLVEIADAEWQEAERRLAAIRPLVDRFVVGRGEAQKRAEEVGIDTATLYRWLKRYKATNSLLSLIPKKPGWKAGKLRIPAFAEAVVEEVIQDFYLTSQRTTGTKAVNEVIIRCQKRGIEPPSSRTIRNRLNSIPERNLLRGRGFKEKAKNKFMPAAGSFPNADYPLAVLQIDHTPADIILVDDVYRKPVGRPWITLAIDVYSRMIAGYYLSFDPPSETSVAMCVAHAILPKDEWLLLHKVDAEWPVWGVPRTIHVDNGADFRSDNFRHSCFAYGINLEFRPVKQPRYGGHIERALGTFLKEIHDLPGTTFSSVKDKEGYDPEKHATMTKSEFEEWLVTLICKVYHERLHSGIGMSPKKKYEIGIFGNAEVPGVGLPQRPADRLTLLLDFLPSFRRTIQTYGVTLDMKYYAEALRPWINAEDPDDRKKKRMFIFRRDPRDISAIWFKDPKLNQYFKIPFADQSLPSMSIWEYRQVKEKLRKEGIKSVNELQILRALTELRCKVDESKNKSKKARRQAQRRTEHEKKVSPAMPVQKMSEPKATEKKFILEDLVDGDLEGFGDIA
ncbi:transposase [Desulfonatronum parangueonense]